METKIEDFFKIGLCEEIMAKLVFNEVEEVELPDGSSIAEASQDAGIPFGCTEGVCGTCIVEIEEGIENLSDYTEEEDNFLGPMENERMACQCSIKSGTVKIKY